MLTWVVVQGMSMPVGYEPSGKWDIVNAEKPAWIALGIDSQGNLVQVKDLL